MNIPIVDQPEASYVWVYETPYGLVPRRVARAILAEAQNHRCCYCGVAMTDPDRDSTDPRRCTIEHLVPVSRGGNNRWENLVAACSGCNCTRPSEMQAIAYFYLRLSGDKVPKSARKAPHGSRPPLVAKAKGGQVIAVFSAKLPRSAESIERAAAHKLAMEKWKEACRAIERQDVERHKKLPAKTAKQKRNAMITLVGHDVPFGRNRLPSAPATAKPIEGATLASVWPSNR